MIDEKRFGRRISPGLTTMVLSVFLASGDVLAAMSMDEKKSIGTEITKLYRAARAVIAKNQELINDPGKGDKGLTPDKVIEDAKTNYKAAGGIDFKPDDKSTFKGQAQQAVLDAVKEVMTSAQPLINEKGKGFKGFLPAIFARQVADSFNKIMAGKAYIKLTAPKDYVRNRANRPDKWEDDVIEKHFKQPGYEKDKPIMEMADHKGRMAFRLMLPEYYGEPCLACHGEPKGATDITGNKKEGAKLGDLGGAISFALYE
jgi:hypothetical protein